jgi:hypothetical protein
VGLLGRLKRAFKNICGLRLDAYCYALPSTRWQKYNKLCGLRLDAHCYALPSIRWRKHTHTVTPDPHTRLSHRLEFPAKSREHHWCLSSRPAASRWPSAASASSLVSLPAMVSRGDMHPASWGVPCGNNWRTPGDIQDIRDTWERLTASLRFPHRSSSLAATL